MNLFFQKYGRLLCETSTRNTLDLTCMCKDLFVEELAFLLFESLHLRSECQIPKLENTLAQGSPPSRHRLLNHPLMLFPIFKYQKLFTSGISYSTCRFSFLSGISYSTM